MRSAFFQFILFSGIIASMFIPVSMSVIGQAEIITNNPSIINAPIDGVIDEILVDNNDKVSKQKFYVNQKNDNVSIWISKPNIYKIYLKLFKRFKSIYYNEISVYPFSDKDICITFF